MSRRARPAWLCATLTPLLLAPALAAGAGAAPTAAALPSADSRYHTYAQTVAEIGALVAAHPSIMSSRVVGRTYEGRDLLAVKVSDHPEVDEPEPEVLLTHHQHAREHLTVEMALHLLHLFAEGYGTDPRITRLVDTREIWVLPDLNPDGGAYDTAAGRYLDWRKNRQPSPGSAAVGTDLNRNWGHHWGCCGGSSSSPASSVYRGPAPESAPEVSAVAGFVRSRVVDGRQQITAAIDFHTYGELVLWPFGWTTAHTSAGMSADAYAAFTALGRSMAAASGYGAEQASELYVTDGTLDDWLWADQGVFAFTLEMYPGEHGAAGFYPPGEAIGPETRRNEEAVLRLLEAADCVYRTAGLERQHCATG